jgi:hypothetical protein
VEEVQKLLMVWINEKQVAVDNASEAIIVRRPDICIVTLQKITLVSL